MCKSIVVNGRSRLWLSPYEVPNIMDDPKLLAEEQAMVQEPKVRGWSMKDEDLAGLRALNPAQKRLVVEVNDAAAGTHSVSILCRPSP